MDIVFIDCTKKPYDGETLRCQPLGGIQSVTINLAESLVKRGHDVRVLNQTKTAKHYEGVDWLPFDTPIKHADVVIVNNDPNLFDKAHDVIQSGARTYLWQHNSMEIFKTLRRRRFGALLRYRPKAIFLSHDQRRNAGRFYPFRDSVVMPHGIHEDFLTCQSSGNASRRPKRAIFFSQAYRGLNDMCQIWCQYIHPKCPDAEYHIFANRDYLVQEGCDVGSYEDCGVIFRERVGKAELIENLLQARVLLYAGHKDETFCNAAAEAMSCGVPIVTRGLGSLKERVIHGKTGFIYKQKEDVAEAVLKIFSDDSLFHELSTCSVKSVQDLRWEKISKTWECDVLCS